MLRGIRRLRRRAGLAREQEALAADLAGLLSARPPATRTAAAPLLERLARRVSRGRVRAARLVRRRRIGRLLARLDRALNGVAARAAGRPGWLDEVASRADRRRAAAQAALATALASGDDEALHRARLAVKRGRYAEECLVAVRARTAVPPAEPERLQELQEVLGRIHEAILLRDLLAREAGRRTVAGRAAAARHLSALAAAVQERKLASVRDLRRLAATAPAARPA
jgi:CHAD domain-containing protein